MHMLTALQILLLWLLLWSYTCNRPSYLTTRNGYTKVYAAAHLFLAHELVMLAYL
jgi:hypothetical protein